MRDPSVLASRIAIGLVSANTEENLSEGEYKTVTLEELLMMLQQDENLCEQISQQLGVETQNPEEIIQVLVNQYNEAKEPSV